MNTKFTLIISVAASLVVGFVAGKIQTVRWHREEVMTPYIYQRDAGNAEHYSEVLTSLQTGHDADARVSLERSLDLALASLQNLPASAVTGDIRSAIRQAKEYRAKYPGGETTPELESRIQKVFSMVQ